MHYDRETGFVYDSEIPWPKGSIQWACQEAQKFTTGKGGGNYFGRIRQNFGELGYAPICLRADKIAEYRLSSEAFFELNWEPVA